MTQPPPLRALDYATPPHIGRYRWVICALLFFATTVNYVDRQVLGVLAPTLQKKLSITDTQYGDINAAFSAAYALGLLVVGGLIDKFGTRWGYTISLAVWSLAGMAHALARTAFGFGAARFALGIGEAGNFPAAIKTVAEWFPKRERALATGIFNSGSNVGAVVAPLVVPIIALHWGWQWAFIATGAAGLTWVAFWLPIYRRPAEHPRVSPAELAHIQSDPPEPAVRIPWVKLLPHRQTWAFAVGKFLTDPIWWFYLFWSAKFFKDKFHVELKGIAGPLIVIYLLADVGSIGGGWLSSFLIKRGWSVNAGRKTAMLVCAMCVLPVVLAPVVPSKWVAVVLIGMAAAAHQGFSANIFTVASDMFPRRAVGSVVGLGGMAGAVGSILLQSATGRIKDYTGSYLPMFATAACAYLIALGIVHALAPRLEPAGIDTPVPQA